MNQTITLEVPATLSALTTVHMVLGGLGARLDFSLDDLDDLLLATDRLLQTALEVDDLERARVRAEIDGETLHVICGSFRSGELRERATVTPGGRIDLCLVLRRLVDDIALSSEDGGAFSIRLVKNRSGSSS